MNILTAAIARTIAVGARGVPTRIIATKGE